MWTVGAYIGALRPKENQPVAMYPGALHLAVPACGRWGLYKVASRLEENRWACNWALRTRLNQPAAGVNCIRALRARRKVGLQPMDVYPDASHTLTRAFQ